MGGCRTVVQLAMPKYLTSDMDTLTQIRSIEPIALLASYPPILQSSIQEYNVTVVNDCVFRHDFALRVTHPEINMALTQAASRGPPQQQYV